MTVWPLVWMDMVPLTSWVKAVATELGGLDIVVCNVSGFGVTPDDQGWQQTFAVERRRHRNLGQLEQRGHEIDAAHLGLDAKTRWHATGIPQDEGDAELLFVDAPCVPDVSVLSQPLPVVSHNEDVSVVHEAEFFQL